MMSFDVSHEAPEASPSGQLASRSLFEAFFEPPTAVEEIAPERSDSGRLETGTADLSLPGVGRIFELLFALFLLMLFSPIMIIIAVVLRSIGSGSVIYRQERVGLRGRPFSILKFRTMREDAEAQGPRITTSYDDDRITPFGKILRKSKMDELPQLFNVIRDEMSFIGPRPERPFFHERNAVSIPGWEQRLAVKPGITGLAQVTVEHDPREKIYYDLQYIENRSLLLDLKILVLTVVPSLRKGGTAVPETVSAESFS